MQPRRFPLSSWAMLENWDVDLPVRMQEWCDIGFTLIMTPPVTDDAKTHEKARTLLDLCAEHNMEALLLDRRTMAPGGNWSNPAEDISLPEDYRDRAAEAVKEFVGHPAVWGIYITDEPLVGNLSAVGKACKIIRELTHEAEPYVNYLPNHLLDPQGTSAGIRRHVGFEDFGAYLDHVVSETRAAMLCYDQYCSMSEEWGGPDQWYRCLSDYQAASIRHNIPFWNIILSVGHWMYKAPNPQQMSWQFYNSLAYGAQGIMYFIYRQGGIGSYGAPVDELGHRGPLFYQLQRQHHQFMTQWAWRFRDCRSVSTYHWPDAPVGVKRFDGSGVISRIVEDPSTVRRQTPPSHLVIGEFRDGNGRPHVVLANGSQEKHTHVTITARGRAIHVIKDEAVEHKTGRKESDDTVSFLEFIMPGQALFFRVEE